MATMLTDDHQERFFGGLAIFLAGEITFPFFVTTGIGWPVERATIRAAIWFLFWGMSQSYAKERPEEKENSN